MKRLQLVPAHKPVWIWIYCRLVAASHTTRQFLHNVALNFKDVHLNQTLIRARIPKDS